MSDLVVEQVLFTGVVGSRPGTCTAEGRQRQSIPSRYPFTQRASLESGQSSATSSKSSTEGTARERYESHNIDSKGQTSQWKRQRKERKEMTRHSEIYALHNADTMWRNGNPVW